MCLTPLDGTFERMVTWRHCTVCVRWLSSDDQTAPDTRHEQNWNAALSALVLSGVTLLQTQPIGFYAPPLSYSTRAHNEGGKQRVVYWRHSISLYCDLVETLGHLVLWSLIQIPPQAKTLITSETVCPSKWNKLLSNIINCTVDHWRHSDSL